MSAYMSAKDVALRWGCSARHVTRLAQTRKLAGLQLGRDWRFSAEAVAAYEAANTTTAESDDERRAARAERAITRALGVGPTTDGFTLPADYSPVFPDLWPGHEPRTRKTALKAN